MDLAPVLLIALFIFLVGLFSGRLERTVITLPMVFVTFGLLVGPVGLNIIQLDVVNRTRFLWTLN